MRRKEMGELFCLLELRFGCIEKAYEIQKLAIEAGKVRDVEICLIIGAGYSEIKAYLEVA